MRMDNNDVIEVNFLAHLYAAKRSYANVNVREAAQLVNETKTRCA